MEEKDFKKICKNKFTQIGFIKYKKYYFLEQNGNNVCGLELQKSNYSDEYYINVYFWIREYSNNIVDLRSENADILGRMYMMSKDRTYQGETFLTGQIEYKKYQEKELESYIMSNFDEWIKPIITGNITVLKEYLSNGRIILNPIKKDLIAEYLQIF